MSQTILLQVLCIHKHCDQNAQHLHLLNLDIEKTDAIEPSARSPDVRIQCLHLKSHHRSVVDGEIMTKRLTEMSLILYPVVRGGRHQAHVLCSRSVRGFIDLQHNFSARGRAQLAVSVCLYRHSIRHCFAISLTNTHIDTNARQDGLRLATARYTPAHVAGANPKLPWHAPALASSCQRKR